VVRIPFPEHSHMSVRHDCRDGGVIYCKSRALHRGSHRKPRSSSLLSRVCCHVSPVILSLPCPYLSVLVAILPPPLCTRMQKLGKVCNTVLNQSIQGLPARGTHCRGIISSSSYRDWRVRSVHLIDSAQVADGPSRIAPWQSWGGARHRQIQRVASVLCFSVSIPQSHRTSPSPYARVPPR